eukprot:XP_011680365.1 PREDICTED: uncharacterized protein LOC105445917 [Strongylocentrotus purpuratus]
MSLGNPSPPRPSGGAASLPWCGARGSPGTMKFFAACMLSVIATAVALAPVYRVDEANDGVRGRYVIKIKDDVDDVDAVVDKLADLPSFKLFQGKIYRRFYHAIKGFSARLSDELVSLHFVCYSA